MAEPEQIDRSDEPKGGNEASAERGQAFVSPQRAETTNRDALDESAVDDIVRAEGDEALKAQDDAAEAIVMKMSPWEKIKDAWLSWWMNPRKRRLTIGLLVLLIGTVFAVPYTRYNILGLVLKTDVAVQVVDSKTSRAVSGATVEIDGQTTQTEGDGKAILHVHTGSSTLKVSKKYYQGFKENKLVTLSSHTNSYKIPLVAQGRQVTVKVVNFVTGKPVGAATVTVKDTSAKTGNDGVTTIVVSSSADTQEATISANGYNTATVKIAATDIAKNTFKLTPAGKLYFLSNLSGRIDVVKTNLDGTERQTVLAGTGNEDRTSTSLLASRDWKYLALLAKRSSGAASLYLIDTTNGDKLTIIDQTDAQFNLVGWSGDRFIYQLTRNSVQQWQANRQALKSYDPTTGQALLLDQTQASGTSALDYVKQSIEYPYIMGDEVVYAKNWNASSSQWSQVVTKQAELDSIGADGSTHKVIKTFALDSGTQASDVFISLQLYEPDGLYIYFPTGTKDTFYDYDDGKIVSDTMTSDTFYNTPYPTYLLSPSGNQNFWSEQRDGKNTLFIGDGDAKNEKQISSLSEYAPYGWYTDEYLLVSKNGSELSIMSSTGSTPVKITDYYKPAVTYYGYGGGYGGL